MTLAAIPVREETRWETPPVEPSAMTSGPAPAAASARPGVPSAGELVALAAAGGSEDPGIAADRVFAAADGSRDRLGAAASLLIERLKLRSDDMEATVALRIVERALVRAPYPDGPWRWAHNLNPSRVRATERRRRRAIRRRRRRRRRWRDGTTQSRWTTATG